MRDPSGDRVHCRGPLSRTCTVCLPDPHRADSSFLSGRCVGEGVHTDVSVCISLRTEVGECHTG